MNESAGTPDFRFNFEGLSRQPSPYEEVIDDDDDDLTAGGRPLEPSDSFDVIGEDEDPDDIDTDPPNLNTGIPVTTSLIEAPSPQPRKLPKRRHSDILDSLPTAGPSRLRGELSLPYVERFIRDENGSESIGNILTSPPPPINSDGVAGPPQMFYPRLSVTTNEKSVQTSPPRELSVFEETPSAFFSQDTQLDPEDSPRISSANSSSDMDISSSDIDISPTSSPALPSVPLNRFTCPICFSPPVFATMVPCGHVCCGECLFTAVKTTMQRAMYHGPEAERAKCPVCRAPIPGWDGMGGGVIGLMPRVEYYHELSE